jgi:hypothetical protein
MTWLETIRPGFRTSMSLVVLVSALFCTGPLIAQTDTEEGPQAWLLTYGPGEIYWQRFGHNAIWIRDPAVGLDHTFNFGFFDFAQQGFMRNFLLGRLNYFAAARPAEVELAEYIDENRSIRAQRLDLTDVQIARLTGHLLNEVSAENREYLYDYYLHNCSTRIRDAIDLAADGAIRQALVELPSPLDFRDHTRRLTGMDYWLYLGLELGLGSPVDRQISRWDELFIPGVLAQNVMDIDNPGTGGALVVEDVMLYESSLQPPPAVPGAHWLRYLPIPAILLLLSLVAVRATSRLAARHLTLAWLVVAGLIGCALAFLWCCTDHWVARLNLNLLLFNPLWLLIAVIPALRKPGGVLILVAGLLALAAPWLPPHQYNADVATAILPLNLVAAAILFRSGSTPDLRQ